MRDSIRGNQSSSAMAFAFNSTARARAHLMRDAIRIIIRVAVIGNQRQSETIREAISEAIRDHQRGNQ